MARSKAKTDSKYIFYFKEKLKNAFSYFLPFTDTFYEPDVYFGEKVDNFVVYFEGVQINSVRNDKIYTAYFEVYEVSDEIFIPCAEKERNKTTLVQTDFYTLRYIGELTIVYTVADDKVKVVCKGFDPVVVFFSNYISILEKCAELIKDFGAGICSQTND